MKLNHSRSLSSIIVIDKPEGITSFGVVQTIRRLLKIKKVGHTGTLDPLATGVLPICLGEATKVAGLLLAEDKTYQAIGLLGTTTDTKDITGEIIEKRDAALITKEQLERTLAAFRGKQQQTPPAFSAVRIQGKRAYSMARQGLPVDLPVREIVISRLDLLSWNPPYFGLEIECSKGTFVRSLIADIGDSLECGAVMAGLRRIKSGVFGIERSITLEQLAENTINQRDLPIFSMNEALQHLPAIQVPAQDITRLQQGQAIDFSEMAELPSEHLLRLLNGDDLIALGEKRNEKIWPKRVFVGMLP
jgi:tRNA pseudouridine55 synthase